MARIAEPRGDLGRAAFLRLERARPATDALVVDGSDVRRVIQSGRADRVDRLCHVGFSSASSGRFLPSRQRAIAPITHPSVSIIRTAV